MYERLIKEIDGLSAAAEKLFDDIATVSRDGEGITRSAYGEKETMAGKLLRQFAAAEGLVCGVDGVGNFQYDLPGTDDSQMIVMASHLDSVPVGGNYDGLAGIVAGVVVQAACRRAGIVPPHSLRTLGLRGEESPWFGTAYLGSKLALGLMTSSELQTLVHVHTKKPLADYLDGLGAASDDAAIQAQRLRPETIRAYLELHIEQGPVLESLGIPIGLATAIRGNIRHPFASCTGVYGHSSASPRHLRSDAVTATAKLVSAADQLWATFLAMGNNDDLIINFGIFCTNPEQHAMTKVPGEVSFSFVLAGTNNEVLHDLYQQILAQAQRIEHEHRVRFDFGPRVGTEALNLDAQLLDTTDKVAKDLGLATHRMPTVGHDAAMFAKMGVPTGMILVRNQHGSHNTEESMQIADFIEATKVLALCAIKES